MYMYMYMCVRTYVQPISTHIGNYIHVHVYVHTYSFFDRGYLALKSISETSQMYMYVRKYMCNEQGKIRGRRGRREGREGVSKDEI